jgi:hypothetical protein
MYLLKLTTRNFGLYDVLSSIFIKGDNNSTKRSINKAFCNT